jgi:cyclopropane fatty-acyl-phospholipid synthase-like methyltransferase
MIAFISARYKFCAKLLEGPRTIAEIGCGDAFGAPIVAQNVSSLLCTDIDTEILEENRARCAHFKNIRFEYHDFRQGPLAAPVDGIYSVDVIEHIYPDEERGLLMNITRSLRDQAIAIFGTPNKAAEQYASKNSRIGHVNLKAGDELRALTQQYFDVVFMFAMNDEVVHTGYLPMAHYLWAVCVGPRR